MELKWKITFDEGIDNNPIKNPGFIFWTSFTNLLKSSITSIKSVKPQLRYRVPDQRVHGLLTFFRYCFSYVQPWREQVVEENWKSKLLLNFVIILASC